jgi:sulfur carrier protein ThiS
MMHVLVEYGTQVRATAGVDQLSLAFDAPVTTLHLLRQVAGDAQSALHRLLFSEPASQMEARLKPGVLVFVNDEGISELDRHWLQDRDRVFIMTMISGG